MLKFEEKKKKETGRIQSIGGGDIQATITGAVMEGFDNVNWTGGDPVFIILPVCA